MVVGGGSARDHALVRALRASPRVHKVIFVPGNSAVEQLEGVESAPVATQDIPGLVEQAIMEEIDLTVIGPNTPIIMGAVDAFRDEGLRVFGPTAGAARLEGSKVFAKNFMMRHQIPTARFAMFHSTDRAKHFVRRSAWGRVVKTDGLAYERGVAVCGTASEAETAIQRIMVDEVLDPDSEARVVIEERLTGPEVTLCVLSDGRDVVVMDANLNYPRVGDGGTGMRTRGMGAVSPAPGVTPDLLARMRDEIALPAVEALTDYGPPLVGALFVDVIIDGGTPYVLDFNVRFGDPATQVLLARLESDLYQLLSACVDGQLSGFQERLLVDPRTSVSVVVATPGYPSVRRHTTPVTLLDGIARPGERFLDVGAMRHVPDGFVTTGGRVATVTALGADLDAATRSAYEGIEMVEFEGAHFRRDIGAGYSTTNS